MYGKTELTTYGPEREDDSDQSAQERPSAVLLVARNQALHDSCRRKLSDAGIDVVLSTPSSDKARELIDNNHIFDAVVIGIDAGDVEGAMLARHMTNFRRDTPTVVMSPIPNLRIAGVGETSQLESLGTLKSAVARLRLRRAYR
jgi:hypothetical protein